MVTSARPPLAWEAPTCCAARSEAARGVRTADSHDPVRVEHVDKAGKSSLRLGGQLSPIGGAATSDLHRDLTLNPDRCYQPTGRPPGPLPKTDR